ncbi:MAG TPA: ThuA domain-containing protein, partial [Gemmataceae bacterium]
MSGMSRRWCLGLPLVLLGVAAAAPPDGARPHLVMMIGEDEYETEKTLPQFARDHLAMDFRVTYVLAAENDPNHFPDLEAVRSADVLLVSVRRRTPREEEVALLREYVKSGKPVVGIRTASHAFELRSGDPPAGHAQWAAFDKEILGCDYTGHFGNKEKVVVSIPESARRHAITKGLEAGEVAVFSSLYKSEPLDPKAEVLAVGKLVDKGTAQPVAWTFTHPGGGRVFCTSLGHKKDFEVPMFQ